MKRAKTDIRNQAGFTLIEIIAVLLLLGILAAVAVPQYLNMAGDAEEKTLDAAVAELRGRANMYFAQALLAGTNPNTLVDFTDIGVTDPNNVFDGYPGTWSSTTATTISYTPLHYTGANPVVFTFVPGTATAPPTITENMP